jgi:hypothetical protein
LTIQSAGVGQGTAATINFSTGLTATVATNIATITLNTATLMTTAVTLANTTTAQVGFAKNILGNGAGNGALLYQSAANTTDFLGQGSAGWLLVSQGGGSPPAFTSTGSIYVNSAVNANNIIDGNTNQIPYQSSAGTTTFSTGLTFNGTTFTATNVIIPGTTNSTGTTTGALTVAGGVGIGGDLYVGGTIYGNLNGGGGGGGISNPFASIFTITNTTNATSTVTGALQVAGGVGIGGNVNIGGTVVGGGIRTSTTSTTPSNPTVGDIWYYPVTDTIYRFTDSGNGSYIWLDINGPGLPGPSGPSGAQGAASSVAGPTGPSGPSGPSGAASSVAGPTGPSGPSGAASSVAGPSGPSGPSGAASSVAGPTGPSGPSGAAGSISNVKGIVYSMIFGN